jgi:retinol dehydrogenase-12
MAKFTLWNFISSQLSRPLPVSTHDLSGQIVVVLGANVGLGYEAAKHFARMHPKKLVLACRNREKAEDALKSEYLSPPLRPAGGLVVMSD